MGQHHRALVDRRYGSQLQFAWLAWRHSLDLVPGAEPLGYLCRYAAAAGLVAAAGRAPALIAHENGLGLSPDDSRQSLDGFRRLARRQVELAMADRLFRHSERGGD